MRLALTVVAPAVRRTADVVLDADPATPVADIAAKLEHFVCGGTTQGPRGGAAGPQARVLRFPGPRSQGALGHGRPAPWGRAAWTRHVARMFAPEGAHDSGLNERLSEVVGEGLQVLEHQSLIWAHSVREGAGGLATPPRVEVGPRLRLRPIDEDVANTELPGHWQGIDAGEAERPAIMPMRRPQHHPAKRQTGNRTACYARDNRQARYQGYLHRSAVPARDTGGRACAA